MIELFKYFEATYYTDAAAFLASIIGLIISFFRRKSELNIFRLVFIGHLVLRLMIGLNIKILNSNDHEYLNITFIICIYCDILITIIEYLAFSIYIHKYIDKNVILKCGIFFFVCLITAYYFQHIKKEYKMDAFLFSSQAVAILVMCASYYKKQLNNKNILLTKES